MSDTALNALNLPEKTRFLRQYLKPLSTWKSGHTRQPAPTKHKTIAGQIANQETVTGENAQARSGSTNREGGADLGHGDADEPGEEGDDDPSPDEGRRPRVLQAAPVQRRDPREERHRREGDGQRLEQRLQAGIEEKKGQSGSRISESRSKSNISEPVFFGQGEQTKNENTFPRRDFDRSVTGFRKT